MIINFKYLFIRVIRGKKILKAFALFFGCSYRDDLGETAMFRGANRVSHFNHHIAEDTYILGGKPTSNVLINDNGGNVRYWY